LLNVSSITRALEQKYPLNLAANWDNSGLQVGSGSRAVTKVVVALDCTPAVVKRAEQAGAELIITHHPLIFSGIKKLNFDHPTGHMLQCLCAAGISVYSLHTNLDRAPQGLNSYLAARLGLKEPQVFGELLKLPFYKLVVYVPVSHLEPVRTALGAAGAGNIGEYSHCSFAALGTGTFLPGENTQPFIGKKGIMEEVEEYRLESIVSGEILSSCLAAVRAAHPYEEMAYEVYPLHQPGQDYGYGRCGELDPPMTLTELARMVKAELDLISVRMVGNPEGRIARAAVVSGSGASLIGEAAASGAQVLITGDVKYHEAQDALNRGLALIDAGHDGLEREVVELLTTDLQTMFTPELQVIAHREALIFTNV